MTAAAVSAVSQLARSSPQQRSYAFLNDMLGCFSVSNRALRYRVADVGSPSEPAGCRQWGLAYLPEQVAFGGSGRAMFSHIAEETTRLAHGFLGAIFGVIIMFSVQNFAAATLLCLALYTTFVVNTLIMKLAYATMVDNRREKIAPLLFLVMLETCQLVGIFVFYFLQVGMNFDLQYSDPIRFSIVVYTAFLVMMNVSHFSEISDQRDLHDTGGSRG